MSIPLQAYGGTPPYSFASSSLPAGLSILGSSIVGTPTSPGTVVASITVTDANGLTDTVSVTFNIAATPVPQPFLAPVIDVFGQLTLQSDASTEDGYANSGGATREGFGVLVLQIVSTSEPGVPPNAIVTNSGQFIVNNAGEFIVTLP